MSFELFLSSITTLYKLSAFVVPLGVHLPAANLVILAGSLRPKNNEDRAAPAPLQTDLATSRMATGREL
jgi:hypothetical protein